MVELFVRYGELGLKSPPVRRLMEKRLASNIDVFLRKNNVTEFNIEINRSWGRIIIAFSNYNAKRIIEIAQQIAENVFGIISVSPVYRTSSNLDEMKKRAVKLAEKKIVKNSTFAVRVKRIGKHQYTSQEFERLVGGEIHDIFHSTHNLTVDLTNPDYQLNIEIKDEFAFFYDQRFEGYGGLPQGTQGTLLSILRGSVEDLLATFLLAKRGAISIPILFQISSSDFTNKDVLESHISYLKEVMPSMNLKYYIVDYNKIMEEIGSDNINCTLCDKICITLAKKIDSSIKYNGFILGNNFDMLEYRLPIKDDGTDKRPIYYPLLAVDPFKIRHPFQDKFKSEFCFQNCPGYKNQKKKSRKLLSKNDISQLVTSIDLSLISPNKP